eukprot:CAMPEP_0115860404 /NCGR_PEP_ID=MMETSP0287-20121206/17111_1 /TAXON_ID=412157 /ORGANISM="Chrysochromulina rotalis, Strain UIO044" /LENGTH=427 /DNA_ID=CAMNT_0003314729 /DNA_START=9 /DNA_END=1292 /DNA_ORIENTATION=+
MWSFSIVLLAQAQVNDRMCSYSVRSSVQHRDGCSYSFARKPKEPHRTHTPSLAATVTEATITRGILASSNSFIGTYTSQIQLYIDQSFAPVTEANYTSLSVVNSSVLNRLHLSGTYHCDSPLRLPSMFVLNTSDATIVPAPNLTMVNVTRFTAMVMFDHVTLSAMIGGTVDASTLPLPLNGSFGYMAVSFLGGPGKNAVRHVRALANNADSVVGINQSPHAEVSFCDVGGDISMLTGRCIWLLATQSALVHDNYVRNCSKHALDFDAYTSGSAAYSNLLLDHGQEGIFVEETASGNLIFNNTIRRSAMGIGVYTLDVGPVANNMIIGNTIIGNAAGMSAGGYGHDPTKHSERNVFASNYVEGNLRPLQSGETPREGGEQQVNLRHGGDDAVVGDYWTSNVIVGAGAGSPFKLPLPADYAGVTAFDPW